MRYSKEAYGSEQAKLRDAEEQERELMKGQQSASQAERLADFTYANVAGVLDYLRGDTARQHQKKIDDLYESAHAEASDLERQHEALQAEVAQAWSSLSRSVERLKRFESEKLRASAG
jgi:hypothetical protein